MIKRIVLAISVVMILFSLSGCFSFLSRRSSQGQMNQIYRTDKEIVSWTESQIIHALNAKDPQLLKSVFSKDVITRANDLDIGIEYILGLIEEEILDVSDRNHSTSGYFDAGQKIANISAWCYVTTATSTYKLSYVIYSINEPNPEKEGVYRLNLYRIDGATAATHDRYRIAGIDYPERECVHKMARDILLSVGEENVSDLQDLFDEQVLETVQDLELGTRYLFDILSGAKVIGNHDSWVIREETDNGNIYQAYIAVETTRGDFVLIFETTVDMGLADNARIRKLRIEQIDITSSCFADLEMMPERYGVYHPGWDQEGA